MSKEDSEKNLSHQILSIIPSISIMQEPPKTRFQIFKKNGHTINGLMEFINRDEKPVFEDTPNDKLNPPIVTSENASTNEPDIEKCEGFSKETDLAEQLNYINEDPSICVEMSKYSTISTPQDLKNDHYLTDICTVKNKRENSNFHTHISDEIKCITGREDREPVRDVKKEGGGEDNCARALLPFNSIVGHHIKLDRELQMASNQRKPISDNTTNLWSETSNDLKGKRQEVDELLTENQLKSCEIFNADRPSLNLNIDPVLVSSITSRLNESYRIQERLASENKTLELSKYQLEERILSKECECEKLQGQVDLLTNEMRELKEHTEFVKKLRNSNVEDNNAKMDSEIRYLEKETERLGLELNLLKKERDGLFNKKTTAKSYRAIETNTAKVELETNQEKALTEVKKMQQEYEIIKRQLDKTLEENKTLIKRECELVQAKTEVANNEKVIKETITKLQELSVEKKISQEEIEDMKSILDDRTLEMQEYRKKYLQAQERVEELNCELNEKQNEIVSVRRESDEEIRIVKALYQEKVAGIDAITATMKEIQVKLYQNQQQKMLLEAGIEEAKRELDHVMDKNAALQKTIDDEKLFRVANLNERQKLETQIVELEAKCSEARNENTELQARSARLDEAISHMEVRLVEKTKEVSESTKCLEEAKEASSRIINRIKERSESSRRNLQIQLAEIERELAGARAAVKAAHKERDEIRHKLQSQINSLTDTLEEGQKRWKGLQAHVSALQSSLCPNPSISSSLPQE